MADKIRPLDVLNGNLDNRVIVQLRHGLEYRGILHGYDHPHINLALKDVTKVENVGQDDEEQTKVDDVIIRGDNIVYVSP